jgi:hypothetical protein
MQRWFPRRTAVATLPPRGKSAEIFPQIHGSRIFLAATHPPRKSQLLPHEKNAPQFCLRFVSTKSHDVNVRRGPLLAARHKRFTFQRISRHAARHSRRASPPHAAQVLAPPMDF